MGRGINANILNKAMGGHVPGGSAENQRQASDQLPEAVVEDVPDGYYVDQGPPPIPEEKPQLSTFQYCLQILLTTNPWLLLIIAIVLYKIWQRLRPGIMEKYYTWQEERKEAEYAAHYHKNPDMFRQKMEAMDEARARMQERYDRDTEQWAAKQKEIEEKKRQQDIEDWENHKQGKGYKNRAHTGEDREREALKQQAIVKGKKGFKPEYNPLMGLGGGSGYRPSPRGGGASGGG